MKVTILGCGSSVGVPSIGCTCSVCRSDSDYNKRTRASILIEQGDTCILVDTSPDLRTQALRNDFHSLDAVLFTHCHADHSFGISELPAFSPKGEDKFIPVYGDFGTLAMLLSSAAYLFVPSAPGAPWKKCHYLTANPVRYYKEFSIGEFNITPIKQVHGEINTTGFIFNGTVAYCTDVKSFPEDSWKLLHNRKMLILGCLRYVEVFAHAHVDLCIEWIKELKPEIAVLTHMSHDIEYGELSSYLHDKIRDSKVVIAHDGLCLEL